MPDKEIALVTGANQGIGLRIAKDLASRGSRCSWGGALRSAARLRPRRSTETPTRCNHPTVGKVALHERGDVRGRSDQVVGSETRSPPGGSSEIPSPDEIENLSGLTVVFANGRSASGLASVAVHRVAPGRT
jgi:NAD(P)-dependent dehydrogenase (short-subunit alcohol dehydrogenase family)